MAGFEVAIHGRFWVATEEFGLASPSHGDLNRFGELLDSDH